MITAIAIMDIFMFINKTGSLIKLHKSNRNIADYSGTNSLQAGAGQVWKRTNVLHLLLKEQQRTGTKRLDSGGTGPHHLSQ